MITEVRGFFKVEVKVKATTVNLENISIEFNKIVLYREEDDSAIVIEDRRVVTEPVRTSEGFNVVLYILNEGEEFEDRIDWLMDEDYEIETIDLTIKNISKNTDYDYELNYNIGEQINKEVEIEVSPSLNNAITYLSSRLENQELNNYIYNTMINNPDLIDVINDISNIKTI